MPEIPVTLGVLLQMQLELQLESFGIDPTRLQDEERLEWLRWNVLALTDELHEMLQETGWKPWSSSQHVNQDAALKEMVDALHFFLNILLVLGQPAGVSAVHDLGDLFAAAYSEKVGVNAQRQATGYDGISGKCVDCRRDLATVDLITVIDADGSSRSACPCGRVVT